MEFMDPLNDYSGCPNVQQEASGKLVSHLLIGFLIAD